MKRFLNGIMAWSKEAPGTNVPSTYQTSPEEAAEGLYAPTLNGL